MSYCRKYNCVHDEPVDISNESGVIAEPVTLQEMKNFLRLEGAALQTSGQVTQTPLLLMLAEGETTVQSNSLIGATILDISREGTTYHVAESLGELSVTFDDATGEIEFQDQGNPGGEQITVLYGIASGNASGDEFDFDDDLIEELITSAREGIEKFTGRSLVQHTWKVLVTNLAGDIELPYSNGMTSNDSGPILDEILDCNGDEIDIGDYKVIGTEFKFLQSPYQEKMTITYTVNPTVPKRLKQAIMRDVAYHYENRNDEPGELAKQAIVLASSFKRVATWLS